jgi:hypothetical protein
LRYLLAFAASVLLVPVARAQTVPPCQPFALAAYTEALRETSNWENVSLVTIHDLHDNRLDRQTLTVHGRVVQTFTPTLQGNCEVGHQ